MSTLLRYITLYTMAMIGLAAWIYSDFVRLATDATATSVVAANMMMGAIVPLLPLVPVALLVIGWRRVRERLLPMVLVLIASILLPIGFSFAKNAIPELVPYYADPALTQLDYWLHFGHDPWSLAHGLVRATVGAETAVHWLVAFYLPVWSVFAIAFPVIVCLTDPDEARARRYIWLFFGAWVVLGNLLALAGSSVGPVFYDRLLGSDRFAALDAAIQSSGLAASAIGNIQGLLWDRYLGGGFDLGLGISAFPSMHLAVATITALYLVERSRWLAPVAIGFVVFTLFGSIYTGYHYAIDGYVSIVLIWLANRYLRAGAVASGEGMLRAAAALQLRRSVR